jgi:hypothetical protein
MTSAASFLQPTSGSPASASDAAPGSSTSASELRSRTRSSPGTRSHESRANGLSSETTLPHPDFSTFGRRRDSTNELVLTTPSGPPLRWCPRTSGVCALTFSSQANTPTAGAVIDRRKRNTEPVALSSAASTDRSPWALRPSALGPWMRPRLTRAPYSVRAASYPTCGEPQGSHGRQKTQSAQTSRSRSRRYSSRGRPGRSGRGRVGARGRSDVLDSSTVLHGSVSRGSRTSTVGKGGTESRRSRFRRACTAGSFRSEDETRDVSLRLGQGACH